MALQPQWPVCCRTTTLRNTQFRVKPHLGLFSRSSLWHQEVRIKFVPCIQASSDYLKRRHKKSLIPKSKTSTPRGFAPRPLVGTSTQKKDQSDTKEKEVGISTEKEDQNDTKEKEAVETSSSGKDTVSRSRLTAKIFTTESQTAEAESMSFATTVDTEYNIKEMRTGNEEYQHDLRSQHVKVDHSDEIIENVAKTDQFNEVGRQVAFGNDQIGRTTIAEKASTVGEQEENSGTTENNLDKDDIDESVEVLNAKNTMIETEDSLLKQREEIDAQEQRKRLENLADQNFSRGNKIFVIPEVVTPDQAIKVFLNRSLSALATEPDVLIMGAYNGWRWKFFTEKMKKTNLEGDWWSCELHVPKEAYRVDFVFFNGTNIYENNDYKDFSVSVKGGMDETKFEEFLLEEKKKELERLAAEENEKKRLAEEQRQMEAEKAAIEAERVQAKAQVEKRRQGLHHVMKLASQSAHDVWQMEPTLFEGGDRIKLYYNRSSRPLAHASEIWIHGGHNNWSEGLSIVEKLSRSEKVDGDWWCADVVVPGRALVLDWVFADGPPGKAVGYDNNNLKDFHATVPKSIPEELFWVEEEHRIFRKVQEDRKAREEALRKKIEKTEHMKAETKERTMKMFLLSQKHIVYTEPIDVRAGNMVTIFYNPSNTILNGKPEVWFRCSFNRWTHPNGPLPPQKMVLAENGSHLKATVKVPIDAYMMDFVFSEREDGGLYDNRNQMDYHIPVTGSIAKEPPMHIVHIAVEMAPIAKVGGLGDVVTSLSRAVQDLGHKVDIILPNYNCMKLNNVKDFHYHNSFAWDGAEIKVMVGKVEGLSVYFLEPQNGMFSVGCIYGRNDDGHRFSFFCHAALEFLLQSGFKPDILHCHDWSSAPVAWLFKEHYIHCGLSNSRVVFTIHNLEFGIQNIGRAMKFADKATTVSQTYSREISGNPAISPHLFKFHGIVNGIDPDIWDPYNDHFIPVSYTAENVVEGKKAAKNALQERLGLKRSDLPLIGIISRLTVQKGIHLIKHAVHRTLERNGQVVLLGSAPDPRIQDDFVNLANQLHSSHADRARFCLTYDEPLSHLIYAGADFILVPSLFEPCGLTQLIAMRYGSIPVVRKTGGLYDTVFDVDNDKERAQAQGLEPNGFSFDGTDAGAVDYALNRAFSAWFEAREWYSSLCKRVMEQDWSWNRPALDYLELYHSARK
ncbi:starch synthase 3, chloroplastic/amyloplastic-like isoform X1 [Zingiber officinale]|uniref:starch synthase 3, chloroplastic/amyloplastic-like isoform X1 n=1 Tax=Zingiber officinale TaxID=94328 RepID=UPI001C4C9336|nr:starch synthase 3, chloroplastic/amyloplastic-like isoform X1 [Zingiber officinale]